MSSHTSTDSSISTTSPSPKASKSSGPTAPTPSKPSTASEKAGPASKPIEELIPTAANLAASKNRIPDTVDEIALANELRSIRVALARAAAEADSIGHRTAIPAKHAESSATFQKLLSILSGRGYEVIAKTTGNFAELLISWSPPK